MLLRVQETQFTLVSVIKDCCALIKFNIFFFKIKKECIGKNPVHGTFKETNDKVIFFIIMFYNFLSFAHAKNISYYSKSKNCFWNFIILSWADMF